MSYLLEIIKNINKKYPNFENIENREDVLKDLLKKFKLLEGICIKDAINKAREIISLNLQFCNDLAEYFITEGIIDNDLEVREYYLINENDFKDSMEKVGASIVEINVGKSKLSFYGRKSAEMTIFQDECIEAVALTILKGNFGITEKDLCKYMNTENLPCEWLAIY